MFGCQVLLAIISIRNEQGVQGMQ